MKVSILQRAKEVMDVEAEALVRARDHLGVGFEQTVELILEALAQGGKVVVTGVGKNRPIGDKIASTLRSTGTPAVLMHSGEALHGDLGYVQPHDVVLAISYSGASEELLQILPAIRREGVPIIAMTSDSGSELARCAAAVMDISVEREACPFNMAPTASTTLTLALGDALAMVLLEARGFCREDYAKLHPGGAIGRTLLLRVEDVMRTGDRVAKVSPHHTVKDAVFEMTRAKAGAVAVIEHDGRLAGIFTDGDLRRHIATQEHLPALKMTEVMTRNPIALRVGQLAVDILRLYEEHNIDDIVVVDDTGVLKGMVDIQDLPKLKVI